MKSVSFRFVQLGNMSAPSYTSGFPRQESVWQEAVSPLTQQIPVCFSPQVFDRSWCDIFKTPLPWYRLTYISSVFQAFVVP